MKKSIIIITIIVLLSTIGMVLFVTKTEEDNKIAVDYIAVFKGESGETVHTTYLYEKKKKKKITYSYVSTVSSFNNFDSTNWNEKIVKKGKLKKKKDIFKKVEKNGSTSYVKYIKEDKIYTIEEFKKIWN